MILPTQVTAYLEAVRRMANRRRPDIVSILMCGSYAIGGYAQSGSDVDLLVVLADRVPRDIKNVIAAELAALEITHGLRERPTSRLRHFYSVCDRRIGGFKSVTMCSKRDLLSANAAAVFQVSALAESLLISTHIFCFATIMTSAQMIWGEDVRSRTPLPAITGRHLTKNCISHLLRNACVLLGYLILPNATKYSMSILRGFLHDCYYTCTSRVASIEEEIDFFQARLGKHGAFEQLRSLRREYRASPAFIVSCFGALVRMHSMAVRERRLRPTGVTVAAAPPSCGAYIPLRREQSIPPRDPEAFS